MKQGDKLSTAPVDGAPKIPVVDDEKSTQAATPPADGDPLKTSKVLSEATANTGGDASLEGAETVPTASPAAR